MKPAAEYICRWLEFQMRWHEQPGCVVALAHQGRVVLEAAFGYADAVKRTPLTPRHLFRVASHSKTFTAAGIMKLREQRKLRLDDRVGRYVDALHPALARATIAQLLSHSAGIVRDGPDAAEIKNRRIALAGGYASHGEPARLVRDRRGAIVEAWLGGTRYLREARLEKEMETRYGKRG